MIIMDKSGRFLRFTPEGEYVDTVGGWGILIGVMMTSLSVISFGFVKRVNMALPCFTNDYLCIKATRNSAFLFGC